MSLKKATKTEAANRIELEVEVDAAAFEAAIQKAYRKNVKKMNVPGFRKGKAPRHYIERIYGEEVFFEDAMNDVYPEALESAIDESGYEFVQDKIDLDVVSVGKEGLVFKAVVTVKPEVSIDGYKGLKAEKPAVEVTDADVTEELEKLQNRQSRLVTVEREAQNGDTVVLDFEGFADGVAFEGGKGENYTLTLGSGQFIPGFEDQIAGKKADEEFEVQVTFPEEYHAEELAGKPVVFQCKLHEVKTRELPELNDDFAKDCSEFDSLEELKADLRAKLQEGREKEAESAFESALADQLTELMKAEIPEAMVTESVEDNVRGFENRLRTQGLELDMYLQYTGMDMDAFRASFRESAEKQVKLRLALEAIAKKEELTATAEEIEAEYAKFAEQYKMEVDRIKAAIAEKALAQDLVVDKAMKLVKENAVVGKAKAAKKPAEEKKAPAKKPAGEKKAPAKKPAGEKKAPAKKPAEEKTPAKKPAAKKTTAKKIAEEK